MMKTTDQIIHEARGLCWHEWWYRFCMGAEVVWIKDREEAQGLYGRRAYQVCKKCEIHSYDSNPSYTSSWADYGKALEWLQSDKVLWHDFFNWLSLQTEMFVPFVEVLLNPMTGSTAIAEFLKERKP